MLKFQHIEADGSISDIQGPLLCGFGITEAIGAAIATFLTADVGVGAATAATLGSVGAGALEGGVVGAITNPKNPLKGAEGGLISGGVAAGISPFIGDTLGLGATATGGIAGALGGAAGAAATGGNIGTGALTGGAGGAISSALTPASPTTTGTAPTTGGPVGSAAATAAPASVPAAAASPAEGLSDVANLGGPELSSGGAPPGGATGTLPGGPELGGGTGSSPAIGTPVANSPAAAATQTSAISSAPTATTPPATATPPGGAPAKSTGIGGFLKDNSWALPAAGLGLAALQSQKKLPGEAALSTDAAALSAQSKQLQNYFTSGTLPAGIQSGLDRATAAAKASIRSQYAAIGDTGSSAMHQDLANVDQVAISQGSDIALNLLKQGVSEQGMADQLYQQIMGNALSQDQALGSAIGAFSSALVPQTLKAA